MSNENGQAPFDEYLKYKNVRIRKSDISVAGIYKGNVLVEQKDMTKDELEQAHRFVRMNTFDIIQKIGER
ncbi:MAG: hypothetical protein WC481_08530 [Candidatus Omnitrophota bacterium]